MSTPIKGRDCLVKKDGTEIGWGQGTTIGVTVDKIKEYKFTSDKPAVLEAGNKSFPFTVDRMYIDKTYASLILAGTKFTLTVLPSGAGDTYTLSNCVIFDWKLTPRQAGVILEAVAGEGTDLTPPT